MAKRMAAAAAQPHDVEALVAEAAYYRAERRGFAPGREIDDWLEAEHEVEKILTGRRATAPKVGATAPKVGATATKETKAKAAKGKTTAPKGKTAAPKAKTAAPKAKTKARKAAAKPGKTAKA